MEAQLCVGPFFSKKKKHPKQIFPQKSSSFFLKKLPKTTEAFGAGASQRGDMQCLHRCLREGPRMAKGLKAATVHEVSGGEVMKGFVVYFAVRSFF